MARTVIISDTHLGTPDGPVATPESLRPLWQDADRLIVNGDLAELQHPHFRANAARQVCRMQDLCEVDGVELVLVSGNHDSLVTDVRHLELADGLVYVTHGDVLHPAISPWSDHAPELEKLQRRALRLLGTSAASHIERLAAAQHASSASAHDPEADDAASGDERTNRARRLVSLARRAAVAMWSWRTLPRTAAAYMMEHAPEARFFVFGHMHRAGTWDLGERVIINTGCYGFPSRPRAVVIDDEQLAVLPVQPAGGNVWCLGRQALGAWPLRAEARRAA